MKRKCLSHEWVELGVHSNDRGELVAVLDCARCDHVLFQSSNWEHTGLGMIYEKPPSHDDMDMGDAIDHQLADAYIAVLRDAEREILESIDKHLMAPYKTRTVQ